MTAHPSPPRAARDQDPHRALHSADGPLAGEHPGRARNPLVKVAGLAWLEFEKPDLDRAERFMTDFGFTVADRMPDTLLLRGRQATVPCLAIRRGPRARSPVPSSRPPPARTWTGWPAVLAGRSPRTGAAMPSRCATPAGSRYGLCTESRTAGAAGAGPATAQLRAGAGPAERPAAAGVPARGDRAAGPRGARHHPVRCRAGLVPGHARADRQRLPVPGRAARTRPGDGLYPL